MASSKAIQGLKHVKPILSTDNVEARRRVINLYRAWYRQIRFMLNDYDLPVSSEVCKAKLREEFNKNRHVTDIRVIDMLCIKGLQDLEETKHIWKQKNHVMAFFKETHNPKPNDFISKFYDGHEP